MNWYKKAINNSMVFYHITTQDNAKKILQGGFSGINSRVWFTQKPKFWFNVLKSERSKYNSEGNSFVILEVIIPRKIYLEEFYKWEKDDLSSPYPSRFYYGEGSKGRIDPVYDRPILKNNINCFIRIVGYDELV